jgi:hypothetical protein
MAKVRSFVAEVVFRDREGRSQEEQFPIREKEFQAASSLAFEYACKVLKLSEFELRLVGS